MITARCNNSNKSTSIFVWLSEVYLRLEQRLIARPMVLVLIMCLFGGYLGYYSSVLTCVLIAFPLICLVIFRILKLNGCLHTRLLLFAALVVFVAFLLGFKMWNWYSCRLPGSEVYFGSAKVCSADCEREGYKNVLLKLETGERVVYLTDQIFEYGTRMEVECVLETITSTGNPGDIDLKAFYNKQGVVRSVSSATIVSLSSETYHPIFWGYRIGARISRYLHAYWQKNTDEQTADFLSAMISGNDHFLSREQKEMFSKSNLAHLLVVSGAHVGYFSSTVLTIFSFFSNNRRKKYLFAMCMLIAYGFLCGWSGSATRSILMYIFMAGISMIDQAADKLSVCAASAIILIIMNPFSMFATGVLLSFSATLSITIFQRQVENKIRKMNIHMPDEIVCAVSCFICAQVGMLPILISLGSTYSILNIIVILLAGFPAEVICSVGLVATFASLAIPFNLVRQFLFVPISGLIQFLISLSKLGALQTIDRFAIAQLPILEWMVLVGIFLVWVIPSGGRRMLVSAVTIFSLLLFVFRIPFSQQKECKIYFLDVGQGDSTLICYKNISILIDGGNVGCGEKIRNVMDYLHIDRIDLAFMSHLDIDHVGGIFELWESGRVSSLYAPFWGESEEMSELRSIYSDVPELVNIFHAGDTISIDSDFFIDCLWPYDAMDGGNQDSLVMLLSVFDVNVIWTGDINEEVERQLHIPESQHIQVLKVAHHGSRFSTSDFFLEQNFIDAAVISVGYNHYGHPTQEVLDRLKRFNIPYYRTDEGGCTILRIQANEWSIRYYFDR